VTEQQKKHWQTASALALNQETWHLRKLTDWIWSLFSQG